MRVFLVDDEPAILEIMKMDLLHETHDVQVFLSTVDALLAAERAPPDLLIVDLRMPQLSGLDLMALLESRGCAPRYGALLVTACCDIESRARAHRLGMSGVLPKPFTREALLREVDRVAYSPAPKRALCAPPPFAPIARRTLQVLAVEDAPANRELISAMLAGAGHLVTAAATGGDGLDAVELQGFDVVLVDLRLPDIDGADVIRWVREAEHGASRTPVRIVAVSADISPEAIKEAMAAGADAYVAKPFTTRQLREAVESGEGARAAIVRPSQQGDPPFNANALIARVGSSAAERILRAFGRQLDGFMVVDPAAESAAIGAAAHSLRGAAALLGFPLLAARCELLEVSCDAGDADRSLLAQAQAAGAAARIDAAPFMAMAA